jgi:multiple sugar transport system permease protein
MQAKRPSSRTIVHLLLLAGSFVFLFPLFWMITTSLKPVEETMLTPPQWIPSTWQFANYVKTVTYGSETLGYIPFFEYGKNTVLLCVLVVAGTVVSNALIAYGFARLQWPGRDLLFGVKLATMMIPFPVLMVPMFVLFRHLGWVGTFRPLWIPAWFGSAFSIFLLRQFFRTIPAELSDAAVVDGCSEFQVFRHIILPLSRPALAVVALFSFLFTWNDFLGPLIYLSDQRMFTLSLGLQFYQSQHGGTEWHLLMAAATIVVVPIIILFFFTQRTFIQGIALTGMKG